VLVVEVDGEGLDVHLADRTLQPRVRLCTVGLGDMRPQIIFGQFDVAMDAFV